VSDRIRQAGQTAWALAALTVVLLILAYVAWYVRVIWPPLLLAGIIVFVLNPLVTFLARHHLPRVAGTAIAYLLARVAGPRRYVLLSLIVAPALAHWAINVSGAVCGWLALRWRASEGSEPSGSRAST
jgi:predicted PurR-regulated permease PerM